AEDRRHVRGAELARHRLAAADQPLGAHGQPLAAAQRFAEPLAVVELVAAGEQGPRAADQQGAAGEDHGCGSSAGASAGTGRCFACGTRYQPGIIPRISFSGPARTTMIRWTRMKRPIRKAQMKWIERADCRPPNRSSSQPQAASMPGDMVRPVRMIKGIRTKITPA